MRFVGWPAMKKLAGGMMAGALLLLVAAACRGDSDKQMAGLVLEAVERNLVEIELLRVRDEDGRVWEFTTEGNVGISAAHLRQHLLLGERVSVTYRREGGRLIAMDVGDAPPSGRYR